MSLPGAGGRCGGGRPIRAWAPTSTSRPRPPLAKMVLSRGMCSCSCSVLVREKKKEKTQPEIGLMWHRFSGNVILKGQVPCPRGAAAT